MQKCISFLLFFVVSCSAFSFELFAAEDDGPSTVAEALVSDANEIGANSADDETPRGPVIDTEVLQASEPNGELRDLQFQNAILEVREALRDDAYSRLENLIGGLGIAITMLGIIIAIVVVFFTFRTEKRAVEAATLGIKDEKEAILDLLKEARKMLAEIDGHKSEAASVVGEMKGALDDISKIKDKSQNEQTSIKDAAVKLSAQPIRNLSVGQFKTLLAGFVVSAEWPRVLELAVTMRQLFEDDDVSVGYSLFAEGLSLGFLGRPKGAIAVYDRLIQEFAGRTDVELQAHVASALINKGVTLGELERYVEETAVYDEAIAMCGQHAPEPLHEYAARAFFNKGISFARLGHLDEAIAMYDQVDLQYGERTEVALQQLVAGALNNKGVLYGKKDLFDEQIAVHDDVIARFGNQSESALLPQVAIAYLNKGGILLYKQQRFEEAIEIYRDLIVRFGKETEIALQEQVARAFVNNAVALKELGRPAEEEIAIYDEVISRYLGRSEASLQEQVAIALCNKGVKLASELKKPEAAIAVYAEVINRYGAHQELKLKDLVGTAFLNTACAYADLQRSDQAVDFLTKWVEQVGKIDCDMIRDDADFDSIRSDDIFVHFMSEHGCT